MPLPQPSRREILPGAGAPFAAGADRFRAALGPAPPAPPAMRADGALLRAFGALRPCLLRYDTPCTTDLRFAALDGATVAPMSPGAFHLIPSRLLATVRCGRSCAERYNQRPDVAAALFEPFDRLPFHLPWLNDDMITGIGRLARATEHHDKAA